jgi:branched-chain amino acid transport system permease protein
LSNGTMTDDFHASATTTFGGSSSRLSLAIVVGLIGLGGGAVVPTYLASDFVLRLGSEGLLLGLLALSVAFLMNQSGLVALGAASIYGGAGYLFAIGMSDWGLTPTAALCVAFLILLVYAATLGALIVRTNPLAFMMLTLAAGEMISHAVLLEGLRDYTGGADGLVVRTNGTVLGIDAARFADPAQFWSLAWVVTVLIGLAFWAIARSRLGAVLRAIRENEERMRFSGFNTFLPRLIVSTNTLVAALIGGISGSLGPILGGLIFSFAQDEFGARGLTQLLTGVAIVVFIVVFPRGVVGGLSGLSKRLGWRREAS